MLKHKRESTNPSLLHFDTLEGCGGWKIPSGGQEALPSLKTQQEELWVGMESLRVVFQAIEGVVGGQEALLPPEMRQEGLWIPPRCIWSNRGGVGGQGAPRSLKTR